jgi:hypothetical protein
MHRHLRVLQSELQHNGHALRPRVRLRGALSTLQRVASRRERPEHAHVARDEWNAACGYSAAGGW